jgi:origin recognition complex subunit 4
LRQYKASSASKRKRKTTVSNEGKGDELAARTEGIADVDELSVEVSETQALQGQPGRKSRSEMATTTDGDVNSSSEKPARARRQTGTEEPQRPRNEESGEIMDIDDDEVDLLAPASTATNGITFSKPLTSSRQLPSDQLSVMKGIALSKLAQRRPIKLQNLDTEYSKVHQLLHATVTAGESNSLLLIGARGSGKTAMVNAVLKDLSTSQKEHFHTIRLNGFIQTDDKLALKEIWRQLGKEMEISDAEDSGGKSYADTLTMLLALLSHPDEIAGAASDGSNVAKSVIFIMDEFDLFATHARQTLLYNLLDIAQSRKAPIAVIGLTTRIDVTEALEKRVKSRFSHRYVHLGLPKTVSEFANIGKAALRIETDELSFEERSVLLGSGGNKGSGSSKKKASLSSSSDLLAEWNVAIDVS